jgi:Tol biopolymer transport system component/DNA-binding winged helix-turn-helix (wHTH) protein
MSDQSTSRADFEGRSAFRLGELTVEPLTGEIRGPAGRERLDPKVMEVLWLLARQPGQVVFREELLRRVWPGVVVSDDALSRCIYQLRRHLNDVAGNDSYKELLETLPKRGYRLNCAPAPAAAGTSSAAAMRGAGGDPEGSRSPTVPALRGSRLQRLLFGAVAATALAVAVAAGAWLIVRSDSLWRDPLAGAQVVRLTDFEGTEQDAAISRDGRLVAFLSDRDGTFDAWATEVGTHAFRNLTEGRLTDNRNPAVRTVTFSPDGTELLLWARLASASSAAAQVDLWAVPFGGGALRQYRSGVAEVAWARQGTRLIYRTPGPGDPMFLAEPSERVGRQLEVGPPGSHSHFPQWSPDDAFVYFVYGQPPDDTDIWRVPAEGGERERITSHRARVTHPVFLDRRTLLYLATAEDGTGPWLHVVDPERRVPHRIDFGAQSYTSLALSEDGRRLVATLSTPRASLWRVPIDATSVRTEARRVNLPHGGLSPRFGANRLLYRSSSGATDGGLWQLDAAGAHELWDVRRGRVVAGPAVDRGGTRIAFVVAVGRTNQLHIMNAEGTEAQPWAAQLDVRGAPAWAPDGRSIAIAADRGGGPQLFKVPLDGGEPIPLVDDYSIDPVWSPDGEWLMYRGTESGPSFSLKAVMADGNARSVPTLILPRGARAAFLPAGGPLTSQALIVLKGELQRKNFWLVDLTTGVDRPLTAFGPEFVIGDFDVAPDGSEIVFDRLQQQSDIVLFELQPR